MTTTRVTHLAATAAVSAEEGALRVTQEYAQFAGTNVPAEVRVTHLYVQVAVSSCIPITGRIITTPLNDETLRPQFIGHKMIVEVTEDPLDVNEGDATWTTLAAGYCVRATLQDALTWEFGIGDVDRVERESQLFQEAGLTVGEPSALLGGPIVYGYITQAMEPLDYPVFTVDYVETGKWLRLTYVSGRLPVISEYDNRTYLNDIARPFAVPSSDFADVVRQRSIFPDLVVLLYDVDTGALVSTGTGVVRGVAGEFTPIAAPVGAFEDLQPDTLFMPGFLFAIDWAGSQPTVGTQYRLRIEVRRATALTPFHFDDHPVDIAAAVYDALGIPYDAGSVTTTKAALGPDLRLVLRPTDPMAALEMLEGWLYGPFGFAYRVVAGVREFYPTRARDEATPPATTLALADLRGEGMPYEVSDRGSVGKLIWEEEGYRYWGFGATDDTPSSRPLDALMMRKAVYTFTQDDSNAPPYLGTTKYAYPGFLVETLPVTGTTPPSFKNATAEEVFFRWGRGTVEVRFPLLPGFAEQIGDFLINTVDYSPIPEAIEWPITVRPKDYPARTPRQVLQVVKRSDSPSGPECVFQVVGPLTADVEGELGALTAPTLSIAADAIYPKNAAVVTVSNWSTITAESQQNRVDIEYGTGSSEPTVWTAAATLVASFSPGWTGTPVLPAGTHVWARARTWNTDGRISTYSASVDLTLDALDPPTGFSATAVAGTQSVIFAWTNGEADVPLVLRHKGPSASDWTVFAWLPAGSTTLTYTLPEPSTAYDVDIFHRLVAENVTSDSSHATDTVTTDTAGGTLTAPAAPSLATGNGGLTLEVSSGDSRASWVLFQVAAEDAGGAFPSYTTFAVLPVVPGRIAATYAVAPQTSPFDSSRNRWYRLKAQHTALGYTDSAFTAALTGNPWVSTAPPPPITGTYVEGDILVADAAGALVPLGIGSTGEVLVSDGTTAGWDAVTGSPGALTGIEVLAEGSSVGTRPAINLIRGSGIIGLTVTDNGGDDRIDVTISAGPEPDTPPSSPDAMDDEFTSASGLWTWNNQGGATATLDAGRLRVDLPANAGDNWRHLYQSLPGGTWEFRAKLSGFFPTNIFHAGLSLRNSSTDDFCCAGRSYSGTYYAPHCEKWTSNTTFSANPYLIGSFFELMQQPYYIALKYDSTYLYWYWSSSGDEGTYIELLKETPATFLGAGVDQVCLSFMVNDGSVAGKAYVHWFRRVA